MAIPARKKEFIDAKVQGALARRIIIHWLVFLLIASLAALLLQVLTDPFRPVASHLQDGWRTHGPFLLVLVFLLPVFVVDTVRVSHRFAGPIFSLRRAMREVAQGQPARRLKFRRRDFWHDLADDYNALLDRLPPSEKVESTSDEQPLATS